jgi:uncharacterized protein
MLSRLSSSTFLSLTFSLVTGTLFGLGLSVSQMIDPAKVVNFLDITGTWDPSLAFVMIGALVVNIVFFRFSSKRKMPVLSGHVFHLPAKKDLDKRLIGGAVLFGAGWGIAGYCPGPLLASLSFVDTHTKDLSIVYMLLAYVIGTVATKVVLSSIDKRKVAKANEACVG